MRAHWLISALPMGLVVGGFLACSNAGGVPSVLPGTDAKVDGGPCVPTPFRTPLPGDAADGGDASPPTAGGACNCPRLSQTEVGGSCNVVVANWPDEGHSHFDPGTPVVYCTKPPSSGVHYGIWASYKTYSKPVPAGYLVHDLEHGAVVLWYKCASSCPDVERKLQAVIDALPVDLHCFDPDAGLAGVKRRLILLPDPSLDIDVAVSAWQWTYRATCVDPTSLTAFINTHYNHAAEDECGDGIDPTASAPVDGGLDGGME